MKKKKKKSECFRYLSYLTKKEKIISWSVMIGRLAFNNVTWVHHDKFWNNKLFFPKLRRCSTPYMCVHWLFDSYRNTVLGSMAVCWPQKQSLLLLHRPWNGVSEQSATRHTWPVMNGTCDASWMTSMSLPPPSQRSQLTPIWPPMKKVTMEVRTFSGNEIFYPIALRNELFE